MFLMFGRTSRIPPENEQALEMRTPSRAMSQIALRLPTALVAAIDRLAKHYNANRGRGNNLQRWVTRSDLIRDALWAAAAANEKPHRAQAGRKHRAA